MGLAYCEPLQPASASNAVDRLADHRSRLNSCHEAGQRELAMDARGQEKRERGKRGKTGPRLTHRAALVDKLRGFAAAASAGAALIASLDSTRLRSAPFDSPPVHSTPLAGSRRNASSTALLYPTHPLDKLAGNFHGECVRQKPD